MLSFTLSVYLSIIAAVNWRENPTITTLKVRKELSITSLGEIDKVRFVCGQRWDFR